MIPTAEEFFNPHHSDDGTYGQRHIESLLIQFARLHVDAALKTAAEQVTIQTSFGGMCVPIVNKLSILNAYPKENIK